MATRTYINGDPHLLKQFLEESGYFDSVTIEENVTYNSIDYLNLITCEASGGVTLRIGNMNTHTTGNYTDTYVIDYANENSIHEDWYGYKRQNLSSDAVRTALCPVYGYQCSGGFTLIMNAARMIVTKNNHYEIVVALTTNDMNKGGNASYNIETAAKQITAYASSDVLPVVRHNTNTTIGTQTSLSPICTSADYGQTSYTTTAFWMDYKQHDAVGWFMYDGKRYFSDGYFAILDEEDAQ